MPIDPSRRPTQMPIIPAEAALYLDYDGVRNLPNAAIKMPSALANTIMDHIHGQDRFIGNSVMFCVGVPDRKYNILTENVESNVMLYGQVARDTFYVQAPKERQRTGLGTLAFHICEYIQHWIKRSCDIADAQRFSEVSRLPWIGMGEQKILQKILIEAEYQPFTIAVDGQLGWRRYY